MDLMTQTEQPTPAPVAPPDGIGKIYVNVITSNSKVKALVSLAYCGIVLKGIRIFEGPKGLFLSPPAEKIGDKWVDHYFIQDQVLRDRLREAVISEYLKLVPAAGVAAT